jgi:hypothetical protein
MADNPNMELWNSYQAAFDYFNEKLFEQALPYCILNFKAAGRSWGFFQRQKWTRGSETTFHEISLNPALLTRQDDMILQMLCKCMVGLWQQVHGTPPKHDNGYYNTEFVEKMAAIGLPCDQSYGQALTHSVASDGAYASIRPEAMQRFFPLHSVIAAQPYKKSRIKYECPECGAKVSGTPGLSVLCATGHDAETMTIEAPAAAP